MTLYERVEQISELDATKSTRRRLLSRAAKACLGLAVVAAGLARAETAKAGAGCCVLAYQTRCTNCTGRGYDCTPPCTRWAWYCVDSFRRVWICGECWAAGTCQGCSCGAIAMVQGSGRLPQP